MTTQEKSKVIASKLGIENWCEPIKEYQIQGDIPEECVVYNCSCGKERIVRDWYWAVHNTNPDFFAPEGQVKLAEALTNTDEGRYHLMRENGFYSFLRQKDIKDWLKIIAETSLAQLFYEFIESEGK